MTRQCENLRITRYTVVARFSAQGLSTEYRKVVVFVGVLTGFMYLSNALTIAGSDPSESGLSQEVLGSKSARHHPSLRDLLIHQADSKTFTALNCCGKSFIMALTA